MASKDDDAKRMLELFHAAYEATNELHTFVAQISKESEEKNQQNKRAAMAYFLGELKQIAGSFHTLHHSMGHLMFDVCWDNTDVGKEFNDPIKELIEDLGLKFEDMEVLDLSQPIPDHLPEEVKQQLKALKQARQMSAKSHLH